jgi:quercetin dioxygenase-like cupin family protein
MRDPRKGPMMVIGPDEGDSYWQPLPSTGYVTVKISPYNSPFDLFSAGMQVLEPGTYVREHGHERAHEMIFVHEGAGTATIDDVEHKISPGSLLMLGRFVQHLIKNDGPGQMKLFWVIAPAGLEDWFAAIGRPRATGETVAPVFERPENVGEIQRQQKFVNPMRPPA